MKIEGYFFGSITVDGKVYHQDLIIFPDTIRLNWFRKQGHSVATEDLEEVIDYKPEVLVVGTGAYGGLKLPASTKKALEENNIKLIEENTDQACEIFNKYIEKGKKAAGAFHLSC